MRTAISQRQLRNDNATIMRRVERGERFTVTRHGVAVAELGPLTERASGTRFVPVAALTAGLQGLPGWNTEDLRRDRAELDALLDDTDQDPWDSGSQA